MSFIVYLNSAYLLSTLAQLYKVLAVAAITCLALYLLALAKQPRACCDKPVACIEQAERAHRSHIDACNSDVDLSKEIGHLLQNARAQLEAVEVEHKSKSLQLDPSLDKDTEDHADTASTASSDFSSSANTDNTPLTTPDLDDRLSLCSWTWDRSNSVATLKPAFDAAAIMEKRRQEDAAWLACSSFQWPDYQPIERRWPESHEQLEFNIFESQLAERTRLRMDRYNAIVEKRSASKVSFAKEPRHRPSRWLLAPVNVPAPQSMSALPAKYQEERLNLGLLSTPTRMVKHPLMLDPNSYVNKGLIGVSDLPSRQYKRSARIKNKEWPAFALKERERAAKLRAEVRQQKKMKNKSLTTKFILWLL